MLKWRARGSSGCACRVCYGCKYPISVKFPGDETTGFGAPTVTKYSEGDGTVNDAMEVPLRDGKISTEALLP